MTPAAILLDRLLDIVVTTWLGESGEDFVSVGRAVLALAISKLPAAELAF